MDEERIRKHAWQEGYDAGVRAACKFLADRRGFDQPTMAADILRMNGVMPEAKSCPPGCDHKWNVDCALSCYEENDVRKEPITKENLSLELKAGIALLQGPATFTEWVERTGLTKSQVSKCHDILTDQGQITEAWTKRGDRHCREISLSHHARPFFEKVQKHIESKKIHPLCDPEAGECGGCDSQTIGGPCSCQACHGGAKPSERRSTHGA